MQPIAQRVIVLGLDGAGNRIGEANTPNIDRLLGGGFLTYSAQTAVPTISGECWGSMFHGVKPELHGLNNSIAEQKKYPTDSPYPSFMKVVKEAYPDRTVASFSSWKPINDGIIEEGVVDCAANARADREHVQSLTELIKGDNDFKLLFVQFDEIDAAGHAFGYGDPLYLEVIAATDALIGDMLQQLDSRGLMEDTLFILLADHGGGGASPRNHGSDHPQDVTIFWGCAGPGVLSGAASEPVRIEDTAAVVAFSLGVEAPAAWTAKVPSGLFGETVR